MGEIPLCASAFTTALTIPNNLIYFRSIMSKGAQCATIGIQTPTEGETRESDQLQLFCFNWGIGLVHWVPTHSTIILRWFTDLYGVFCRSLQEPSVGVNAHCHLTKETGAIRSKIPRYVRYSLAWMSNH